MRKAVFYFLICCLQFTIYCQLLAQVGINSTGSQPAASAMLDVSSTSQGTLITRMNTAQRNAIGSPSNGLMIYNTDCNNFNYFNGTGWVALNSSVNTNPPSFIASNSSPCPNATGVAFSVAAIPGPASYIWTVPTDATIATGQGTNAITVDFGTSDGNVCVTISNACITSIESCIPITINSSCPANLTACSYNGSTTFTDTRDSKTYFQTQIGSQCWMANNLNYGSYVTIATGQGTPGTKFCYGDDESNCNLYGGLYEWANVMNGNPGCNGTGAGQPACNSPVQGLCPDGWHVPSHHEWTLLEGNVGTPPEPGIYPYDETTFGWFGSNNEGSNLEDPSFIGGNNSIGFNMLAVGFSHTGSFSYYGVFAYFWTSTDSNPNGSNYAWLRGFYNDPYYASQTSRDDHEDKTYGFSMRCIHN
jgi:uncharacterized protein (TIGR02145 family)